MNKNTKQARKKGWASMADMIAGEKGNGKRLVSGVCVDTRRIGRKRWVGAAAAAKASGRAD